MLLELVFQVIPCHQYFRNPNQGFQPQAYKIHAPPILHTQTSSTQHKGMSFQKSQAYAQPQPLAPPHDSQFIVLNSPESGPTKPTRQRVISNLHAPHALSPNATPRAPLAPLDLPKVVPLAELDPFEFFMDKPKTDAESCYSEPLTKVWDVIHNNGWN